MKKLKTISIDSAGSENNDLLSEMEMLEILGGSESAGSSGDTNYFCPEVNIKC